MTIIIDPFVNVYYASFYIRGFGEKFGNASLRFGNEPFRELKDRANCFNFVIQQNEKSQRVTIDAGDFDTIDPSCYHWCDVYGKVNTNWAKTPKADYPKIVSLAPSFGIRLWNWKETAYHALFNLIKSESFRNARKFLGKYKRQFALRLPLSAYTPEPSKDHYIFHVSTLWQNDEYNQNDEKVNNPRANFMEVCKTMPEIEFEGGFYFTQNHPLNPRFKELAFHHYLSAAIYLQKTKESCVVFNTPAFWNCHGWKLGEYLALGKAIISTPLSNDLPEPLVHGENIHIISNDKKEMEDAIRLLVEDKIYRNKLEQGARAYYLRNATPAMSLALLGIGK
jgi:hypothetical protein